MTYNFDEIVDRSGTYSFKYDVTKIFWPDTPDNCIPMSLADMDFVCPQPIVDAMHKVADFNLYAYTSAFAAPGMMNAICRWWKDKYHASISQTYIKYVGKVMDGIANVLEGFTNVGDGVIVQRPVYSNFTGTTEHRCHRTIVDNHLLNDGNGYYTMDFDDLEKKCSDPNNRAMILCSPANPVGRVWKKEELKRVCEITKKYNVLLICDEIHADIRRRGVEFTTILNATDDYSNIIVFAGINKTFNCAGLHGAFAIIPDAFLRSRFDRINGMQSPTPFGIAAIEAGYNEGDEWLEQVNDYIDGNIDWVIGFLHEKMPWAKCYKPEGTYILWVDFGACGLDPEEIHHRIFIKAAVRAGDGTSYDPTISNAVQRFCIPFPRAVVKEAFERIAAAFEGVKV